MSQKLICGNTSDIGKGELMASQLDMQILLGRDQSDISRHINNIFKEKKAICNFCILQITDGDKRNRAFLFILFLAKNKILFDENG